ncbi:MAG: RDD family protein [Gammaproteobacteria bacterium]|nr:RDD family protein [Gammaproteobacteria bacterium]
MPENAQPPYAGFWLRACAHLIDSLIVSLLLTVLLMAWLVLTNALPRGLDGWLSQALQFLVLGALTVWLWRRFQATPGKQILGLRIVDATSLGRPETRQLVIRYGAYLLSLMPLGLGFFWVAFDEKKQGWHDKLAGTVVLRSRPERGT